MRERCQALDENGLQCRCRKGVIECTYRGDPEIYSGSRHRPTWVVVNLCPKHLKLT